MNKVRAMSREPKLHFYRYGNNWTIGLGFERTFNSYNALRLGLGWWCLSLTWKREVDV